MKKIILVFTIIMTMAFSVNAQSDGFFRDGGDAGYRDGSGSATPLVPGGPTGTIPDTNAPLGSGLLILTALGGAYLLRKKN